MSRKFEVFPTLKDATIIVEAAAVRQNKQNVSFYLNGVQVASFPNFSIIGWREVPA